MPSLDPAKHRPSAESLPSALPGQRHLLGSVWFLRGAHGEPATGACVRGELRGVGGSWGESGDRGPASSQSLQRAQWRLCPSDVLREPRLRRPGCRLPSSPAATSYSGRDGECVSGSVRAAGEAGPRSHTLVPGRNHRPEGPGRQAGPGQPGHSEEGGVSDKKLLLHPLPCTRRVDSRASSRAVLRGRVSTVVSLGQRVVENSVRREDGVSPPPAPPPSPIDGSVLSFVGCTSGVGPKKSSTNPRLKRFPGVFFEIRNGLPLHLHIGSVDH